jgi:hypothetical protein
MMVKTMATRKKKNILYCSFCGKSQYEVKRLVDGQTAFVCDECVALCVEAVCRDTGQSFAKEFLGTIDLDWGDLLTKEGFQNIVREIEFPPEYYSAGMTILANFSRIVRDRFAANDVKISIQQEHLKVRLIIETPNGVRELIEETMSKYNLVVQGKMLPEQFASDPLEILDLKTQLRIA